MIYDVNIVLDTRILGVIIAINKSQRSDTYTHYQHLNNYKIKNFTTSTAVQ